jgi:hypothetical protein
MKCTPVRVIEVAEIRSLGKFMGKDGAGCGIVFGNCGQFVIDAGKLERCDVAAHAGARAHHVDGFAVRNEGHGIKLQATLSPGLDNGRSGAHLRLRNF